ncbi:questin oxidase family protein, partial [Streptomyces sp. NPDC002690]
PVADLAQLPGRDGAAATLDLVPPVGVRDGGFSARLDRVGALPVWAADVREPGDAYERLTELVRAATHRYATHGHGDATMLVHAATAPNAVLRTLPALPEALWPPSLRAAWTASAAVTAMYAPDAPVAYTPPGTFIPEEVFERALAHGDEHVIKLTDTALDFGDRPALAAAWRSIELTPPE